jgi:hypothetical protein
LLRRAYAIFVVILATITELFNVSRWITITAAAIRRPRAVGNAYAVCSADLAISG